jgi:hypothetical protein
MTERDLPAEHYLRVYRLKLRMARASPEGMEFFRRLVDALSALKPDTPIHLETSQRKAVFKNALTGTTLAELRLGDV